MGCKGRRHNRHASEHGPADWNPGEGLASLVWFNFDHGQTIVSFRPEVWTG